MLFRSNPPFNRSYSAIGLFQALRTEKFTQELRIASDGPRSLSWLVGGFYTHESSSNKQLFEPKDLSGQSAPNDLFNFFAPSTYEEYAVFGDATYRVTQSFDVSAGVRYARNDQIFTQVGTGLFGASRPSRSASENVVTYLANARYHLSDRATAYARFATGYRPGGPNSVLNDPLTGLPLYMEIGRASCRERV